MWDFSWLLRHHRLGEFEDWDEVLDGLALRGYNAIRIDCFPHLVAAGKNGTVVEEFYHVKDDWTPALWGNAHSIYSRPREALLEFLPKCAERDIHVGLATWFSPHGTERNSEVEGVEGFVRVWDETLSLLDKHALLDNVLYVDLLNEYPLWHGLNWLKREMNALSGSGASLKSKSDAHIPDVKAEHARKKKFNADQEKLYISFMTESLRRLKARWPHLDFLASQSNSRRVPWQAMDYSEFDCLDVHLWFVHNDLFFDHHKSYFEGAHDATSDVGFERAHREIKECWATRKEEMIAWMEGEIKLRADVSRQNGLVCGNTEGWGPINWRDHPLLDWDFTKEAGEVCVDIALRNGFKFICTSNFTHPQFPGIWKDIGWHRGLTERIRNYQAT